MCEVLDAVCIGDAAWNEESKRQGFMDLGIDSMNAVDFVQNLNDRLAPSLTLPPTIVFDQPNVSRLACYVHKRLQLQVSCDTALPMQLECARESVGFAASSSLLPSGVSNVGMAAV